jgi:hypothetical protein
MPVCKSVQLLRELWLLCETHKDPEESDLVFFLENMGFAEDELEAMRDDLTRILNEIQESLQ